MIKITDENTILEEESTVNQPSNSNSKRTIIPQRIVKNMGLNGGDKLIWKLVVIDNVKYYILDKKT